MSKPEKFIATPVKAGVHRTPDAAFADLPDFPFQPNYIEVDGMRMHYIDEGRDNKKTIFLLHGQPSWSYLYRHMIPLFGTPHAQAAHRKQPYTSYASDGKDCDEG